MDGISNLQGAAEQPVLADAPCVGDMNALRRRDATKLYLAMVEIVAETDGLPPGTLIRALYRLSERGKIVFALTRLTPHAVDTVLDEIVGELPLTIPGVLYINAEDDRSVGEAARHAGIVIAASADFHARVMALPLMSEPPLRAALLSGMPPSCIPILISKWGLGYAANRQYH
jgi:hypothetical protein